MSKYRFTVLTRPRCPVFLLFFLLLLLFLHAWFLSRAGSVGAVPSRAGWPFPQLPPHRHHDLHRPAQRHGIGRRIHRARCEQASTRRDDDASMVKEISFNMPIGSDRCSCGISRGRTLARFPPVSTRHDLLNTAVQGNGTAGLRKKFPLHYCVMSFRTVDAR